MKLFKRRRVSRELLLALRAACTSQVARDSGELRERVDEIARPSFRGWLRCSPVTERRLEKIALALGHAGPVWSR